MQRLTGIGNVWNTIRELNVSDIKESAEQPVSIALIGPTDVRAMVVQALFAGPNRFAVADRRAVQEWDAPLPRNRTVEVGRCDLALVAIDTQAEINVDPTVIVDQLAVLSIPTVALFIGSDQQASGGAWYLPNTPTVHAPDAQPATLLRLLAPVIVDHLSEDQRMAAARRVPMLREAVARWLINDVSFSNATYALTSGIPEMIPILNIPLNATDMLVLTKNQALMVYKVALAFGAPPDFQAQMREILPVIGGGFVWRQVARQLVGLIPGFGILPKVAVSYAGTYATGQAATIWYRSGEALSGPALKRLYQQAFQIGKQRAQELIQRRKQNAADVGQTSATGETKRMNQPDSGRFAWLRRLWPLGRKRG